MRATRDHAPVDDDPLLSGIRPVGPRSSAASIKPVPATRIVLQKNHSADQRSNLKRAYAHFMYKSRTSDPSHEEPSPSDTWPKRPYAASV